MRYFADCKTVEDVKQRFKKLARELHPDCNRDRDTSEEFKAMYSQYEEAFERLKNIHVNAAGETYEKESTETASQYADLIEKLLHMPGLVIELCGSWLWVTGNTKEHKEELKELGFKYSPNKYAWYYHSEPYHKRGKSKKSMEDIRSMYGSQKYATRTEEMEKLPA